MASSGSFSIVIKATDLASATFDKLNKRLAAFNAPFVKLNKSFEKFGKLSGLNRIATGFKAIEQTIGRVLRSAISLVPVLGGLAGAGILAGIYRLVESTADWATHLKITADYLGIATSQLSLFELAARLAGSSSEDMDKGLDSLQKLLDMASLGEPGGANAFAIFTKMGLSISDMKKPISELMPKIAEFYKTLNTPQKKRILLDELHLPASFDQILKDGAAGWQKYIDAAKATHPLTDKQIEDAARIQKAFTELQERMENMAKELVVRLGPAIVEGLGKFSAWIESHQKQIEEFFDKLPGRIEEVITKLTAFATGVDNVVQKMGGWKDVMIAIAAIELAKPILGVLAALTKVGAFLTLNPVVAAVVGAGVAGYNVGKAGGEDVDADLEPTQLDPDTQQPIMWKDKKTGKPVDPSMRQDRIDAFNKGGPQGLEEQKRIEDQKAAEARNQKLMNNNNENTKTWLKGFTDWWDSKFGETAAMDKAVKELAGPNDASGYNGGGTSGPPLAAGEAGKNAQTMADTWRKLGWSEDKIAAGLAEAQIESGFNPRIHEKGGSNHIGMFQHDATRQANFVNIYHHRMDDANIPTDQLAREQAEFADWEMKHTHKKAADAIDAAKTAGEKADAWNQYFEGSGKSRGDSGLGDAWRKKIPPPTAVPPPTPPQPPGPVSMDNSGDWKAHIHIHDPKGYVRTASVDSRGKSPRPLITTTNTNYGYA
jgi:Phage tail lysozyme